MAWQRGRGLVRGAAPPTLLAVLVLLQHSRVEDNNRGLIIQLGALMAPRHAGMAA